MQKNEQSEQFLASMTLALSNYLIVATSKTTLSDQRFLFEVVSKWKAANAAPQDKFNEVFVLHNFRDIDDISFGEKVFKVQVQMT